MMLGVLVTPEQFAAIISALGLMFAALAKLIYEVRKTRTTAEKVNHAVNNRPPDSPTLVEMAEETRATVNLLIERVEDLTQLKYTSHAFERLAEARMDRLDSSVAEILGILKERPK